MPLFLVALTFLIVQFVSATWLVNCWIMRLTGSMFKEVSMAVVMLVGSAGTVALLWFGWRTQSVQSFLALQPRTPFASALLALLILEIAITLWLIAWALWRRLTEKPPAQVKRFSTRLVEPDHTISLPGLSLNHSALHLTEVEAVLPHLPPALDGLRLLHLSDMHIEWAEHLNQRVLAQARTLAPDLILVTGDFIVSHATPALEALCAGLRDLAPPLGAWCIRGNHDIWHDNEKVVDALARHGLPLLDNRRADVEHRGARLRLVGVEHPWNPVNQWDALMGSEKDVCRIVLSHTPDNFARLAAHGADLILSGHTHGGQWRLPFLGSLIVPSNHGRRYDHGLFAENGTLLSVTRGIGCVGLPLRLNCAPEITLFTLRASAVGS